MTPEQIIIGTPVIYHSVITNEGERLYPKQTIITSTPWTLGCGHLVCKVEGVSGGVSLKHLTPIEP